ncbi:hypothetical protein ACIQYW_16150 [Rhodococcus erythropolis]|jgi:hypothetical protein|uniref:hypothetical protein n=1 Tax=Rhodococcus baikonurensis TaxID=172041 RepID=UPI0026383AC5|nr:hypothetical protein [uncultured Rhodococcus sp.]
MTDITASIATAIQAKTGGNVEGKIPEWWAEFIGMVLAELHSNGRLIPAGGMALTAEQVEDVRALVWLDGRRNFDAFYRLRALFPATEPAAVRDGSDLVVVERSHTAKAVQSWMTLDLWTDLGKSDKDFDAEYERRGFGDLWAILLGEVRALVQATEPAEEETKAETETEWGVEFPGGICNVSFDPAEAEEMVQWIRDGQLVSREVTTGPWVNVPASSPVVPAPTETGPWQTWQEVPEGVQYYGINGWGPTYYVNRGGVRYRVFDDTPSKTADYVVQNFAPFVAAAEEG